MIDADFRPERVTLATVAPYLSPDWKGYLRLTESGESLPGTRVTLPESVYWIKEYDEFVPLCGTEASEADSPLKAAQRYFDAFDVKFAVCNPGVAGALSAVGHVDYANAVGRAVNDWMVAEWVDCDERVLGSLTITLKDPAQAAEEIRRVGSHERVAQVLFAQPPRPLGDPSLDVIWEAAVEQHLPVNLEAKGAFTGMNPGLTGVGHPASRFEYEVSWIHGAQSHLLSMITAGVFDRFPDLTVILNGFGGTWLPSLIWRLEAEQRISPAGNAPALQDSPKAYVRKHVRFTSRGLDLPDDAEQFARLLELFGGQDAILLASGPIGGTTEMNALLEAVPKSWREDVAYRNAAATYLTALGSNAPS
jgi:hypothetical protein